MSEINIAGVIDKLMIFGNKDYCAEADREFCEFLNFKRGNRYSPICRLFKKNLSNAMSGEYDSCMEEIEVAIKCDQCKTAYQKTKDNEALKIAESALLNNYITQEEYTEINLIR